MSWPSPSRVLSSVAAARPPNPPPRITTRAIDRPSCCSNVVSRPVGDGWRLDGLAGLRQDEPVTSTEPALAAWGAYDLDNPFPLFATVRELGAVHSVTLADGHAAWLVVGHDEARAALNDPRMSKDMQAAL